MNKINILWTTDNKDTVFNMLSMYAINSKKREWWQEVNVIIWGASVKLVGNDTQIQTEVLEMLGQGLHARLFRCLFKPELICFVCFRFYTVFL